MSVAGTGGATRDLPWGWWLRADASGFKDDEGRSWRSVRDAYWQGKLNFPEIHVADEQLELLTRVLTSIGRRWIGETESRHDLFGGDMLFWRFYMCWLASIGVLDMDGAPLARHGLSPFEAHLSGEGRSVMLMLQATRQPEWVDLPMASVVDAVRATGRDRDHAAREAALQSFERSLGRRRYTFARERVHTTHLVTLTAMVADARMPTFRVIWSQSFGDDAQRDDLFAWMAERVDRWDDWADLAYRTGAPALSQHLLGLIVATRADEAPC